MLLTIFKYCVKFIAKYKINTKIKAILKNDEQLFIASNNFKIMDTNYQNHSFNLMKKINLKRILNIIILFF